MKMAELRRDFWSAVEGFLQSIQIRAELRFWRAVDDVSVRKNRKDMR